MGSRNFHRPIATLCLSFFPFLNVCFYCDYLIQALPFGLEPLPDLKEKTHSQGEPELRAQWWAYFELPSWGGMNMFHVQEESSKQAFGDHEGGLNGECPCSPICASPSIQGTQRSLFSSPLAMRGSGQWNMGRSAVYQPSP